jgi:superfamily II DNA/RNA helicase
VGPGRIRRSASPDSVAGRPAGPQDRELQAGRRPEETLAAATDPYGGEVSAQSAEDVASLAVSVHLPEERHRISEMLATFPQGRETKVEKLLAGLGVLWRQNSHEKVVIFATYLGTVEQIAKDIEAVYPGQGVAVLRGGDHGAKLAAERRFRQKDGPRVLVCTAAGREGINIQFARVLFNFDLPWNPMDVEQRIGRIHRYGQRDTAQVYNLILLDTIEGRIFLMLDQKLVEIARALGGHRRRCRQYRWPPRSAGHDHRQQRGRTVLDRVLAQSDRARPARRQAGRLRRT